LSGHPAGKGIKHHLVAHNLDHAASCSTIAAIFLLSVVPRTR
jgi:hypothetical protein